MIPDKKQTKTYTGAEKDPGIGYRPTVSRQQSYAFEREIEVTERVTRKEIRVEPKAKQEVKTPTALQVLQLMQQRIDDHISEVRRLHLGMMIVREVSGVEYEVKMPSLVG
jgi:LEA14-like dessication related protein